MKLRTSTETTVLQVLPVHTKQELASFIDLPYRLYKDDPVWIPPLRSEVRAQFNRKKNPTLDHCEYELFLLKEGDRVMGRIAAFIDTLALEHWNEPVGLFGYFECINQPEASRLLFDAASDWLRSKGMKYMRGPWSFVSQEWGLVIEGFTPSPCIMAPYNPDWYIEHLTRYGLVKIKDLLCYYMSVEEGYQIPDRILTLTDDVARRYQIRTRQVDMKHYDRDVQAIIEISNQSLDGNWGYAPVTQAEAEAIARDLKPVIQPKGVIFAEDADGRPVGFAITLPDVNVLLKGRNGRLFPLGIFRLLMQLPKLHRYRMFALGVIPEYHGRGVDSLIYRKLYESLYAPDVWMEINYVLEDNFPMNNAIHKLEAKPLRKYRVYQKAI